MPLFINYSYDIIQKYKLKIYLHTLALDYTLMWIFVYAINTHMYTCTRIIHSYFGQILY